MAASASLHGHLPTLEIRPDASASDLGSKAWSMGIICQPRGGNEKLWKNRDTQPSLVEARALSLSLSLSLLFSGVGRGL